MPRKLPGVIIACLLLPAAATAQPTSDVTQASATVIGWCTAGDGASRVRIGDRTDGTLRLETVDGAGKVQGEFRLRAVDLEKLLAAIHDAAPAGQAERLRDCLRPLNLSHAILPPANVRETPIGAPPPALSPLPAPPLPAPTPPAPSPPAPAQPSAAAETRPSSLQEAIDRLLYGHVAFETPEKLVVDRQEQLRAVLSVDVPVAELMAELNAAGKAESAGLRVSDQMVATLEADAEDFDVLPKEPQPQLVSRTGTTEWTWLVTPKRAGPGKYLVLAFDAVIRNGDKDGVRRVRTFTKRLDVEVGWPRTTGEWIAAAKEWAGNIQWLWAAILLPAGLLARRLWLARRSVGHT